MKQIYFKLIVLVLSIVPVVLKSQSIVVGGAAVNQIPNLMTMPISCVPLFSFDTDEPDETGIASDGNYLWIGGAQGSQYYKADGTTGFVTDSIPKPLTPGYKGGDIDVDGNYLWNVIEQEGTLYKIDVTTGLIANQWILPNNNTSNPLDPNNFGIAIDNGVVWETEYLVPVGSGTYLHKFDAGTMNLVDSFYLPNVILPIKIIDGALWGAAFDVPYLFKIDRTTGLYLDSVPRCVNLCYGLTKNAQGFWLNGNSTSSAGKIHLFETLPTGNPETETASNLVSVYPNPASEYININSTLKENIVYIIYNITGELVSSDQMNSSGNENSVSIQNLIPGMYFIEININNQKSFKKFIKK